MSISFFHQSDFAQFTLKWCSAFCEITVMNSLTFPAHRVPPVLWYTSIDFQHAVNVQRSTNTNNVWGEKDATSLSLGSMSVNVTICFRVDGKHEF